MPLYRPADVPREAPDPDDPLGQAEALLFSDAGGLTQFGAFAQILAPGARSAIPHWHSDEDEMVYLLEGDLTVHEGDEVHALAPGEAVTFKAGVAVAHYLHNTGPEPARALVIGTRAPVDRVTCPEHDRVLHIDRTAGTRVWTTLAGAPADDPEAG